MKQEKQIRFSKNIIITFVLFLTFFLAYQVNAKDAIVFDGSVASNTVSEIKSAENTAIQEPISESINFTINLDKETIAKGYTVSTFDESLKLSLVPGILSQSTRVDCEVIPENMPIPWNLEKISKIYQFEFRNKSAYDNHKPFYIQFSYDKESDKYKRVFFYDKNYGTWRELPTRDYPNEKFVRSLIHLPYARIAVFESPKIMSSGKASWYAYKGGNFAASTDFPKGSKLRVYNLDNNKFVDVEINDYGPDKNLHPDRAIDLDKVAFLKIANLGSGIIDVNIEPIKIMPDISGRILGVSENGASIEPIIKSKSIVVINESNDEVLISKNSAEVFPIASLTKLIAVRVFFDQKISLNKEATYKKQDELYNYQYCEPWESAKLKVEEGDIMTMEDLVYSALVGSANNAVESLVRESGISREDFIAKMNEFAKSVGAINTKFIEPTGLSPENVSTANDYAIMVKEIFKNPLIEKISITPSYEFYTVNTKKFHRLLNTNVFIRNDFFASTNDLKITGSKTGYLDEALYCLMARAIGEKGEDVMVVSLGAPDKTTSMEEVKELIKYGISKIKK